MGNGYTRNDTANNIADGNVINASDLDGEFDAIQSAFNATTGHSHDGTTGEGPQIGTGGIADNAVTLGTKTTGNYVAAGAVSGVGLSGSASAEGATFTVTSNATSANTASTIVARDASGNFSAGTVTAALTGNADTATTLETARTIGGVSFDGSANINLPGVNTAGNQDTSGNAATATALETARTIAGNSFDGTANITIASTDLSDSGSINAATLDSIDSTSFLRSDAADTKTSGDLSFSDNVKAIFGAGSDLQIYHDGLNSYIKEAGTGDLIIGGSNYGTRIQDASGNDLFVANPSSVTLLYNGSPKLDTTSSGIDVTGTVTFAGGTTSADLNFGDNDKAIFGAGSDLQIYHDVSNSYIDEVGAGVLKIRSNGTGVDFESTGGETLAQFVTNGAVTLYHNNSPKISTTASGIDVQGSMTADGLTVDGDVDITGAQPRINLKENDTTDLDVTLRLNAGDLIIETRSDAGSALGDRIRAASNGDISFYDSTGVTQGLYWDASAESLGIGTTTPSNALTIESSGSDFATMRLTAPSNTTPAAFQIRAHDGDFDIRDANNSATRMTITSGGNVGIGTSSPAGVLDARANSTSRVFINGTGDLIVGSESGGDLLQLIDYGATSESNANPHMEFSYSSSLGGAETRLGYVGYGSASNSDLFVLNQTSTGNIKFSTNNTEAMRIDSSGDIIANAEGGSNTTSLRQGAAKVWANINQASGTTPASFNVTSFTDVSAGRLTITIGNNMDSGAYVITTSFYSTASDSNVLKVDAAPAAGSYTLQGGEYQNGATNVARDFQRAFSAVHGDLA